MIARSPSGLCIPLFKKGKYVIRLEDRLMIYLETNRNNLKAYKPKAVQVSQIYLFLIKIKNLSYLRSMSLPQSYPLWQDLTSVFLKIN